MAQARVIVVGGGAIGASVAYYLARQGHAVQLIERDDAGRGCSYGNAGLIVPSHSVSLATPKALLQGMKWIFDSRSPFRIQLKPDPALLSWLIRFAAACRPARFAENIPALVKLGIASLALHQELSKLEGSSDLSFQQRGWLHVYKSRAAMEDGVRGATLIGRSGVRWERLDGDMVRSLEPTLRGGLAGGIYYPSKPRLQSQA
jgi:D-amino-acid dehydrogenase